MSEKMYLTPEMRSFTRRKVIKTISTGAIAATLGADLPKPAYESVIEAYRKARSVGSDYSNDPFWKEAAGATTIDRSRLDELLGQNSDIALPSYRVNEDWHEQSGSLTEFAFFVDEPGPIYAELEGLSGVTSLTLLKASVDDGNETLIPIIRDPEDQTPIIVQLGIHDAGRHQLYLSIQSGTAQAHEVTPLFSRGDPNSLRSAIDMYQPVVYPHDTDNITNNFPMRTLTFVYESPEALALVYWKECLGEDKEYGRIGTSVHRLYDTKQRTTDIDWDMEILIDKQTLQPLLINIAEPYHNRVAIPTDTAPRTPLRIASLNNNVELLSQKSAAKQAGISIRSEVLVHDERWRALYSTTPAIGRLSIMEHIKKGHLNPKKPYDMAIIQAAGIDIDAL